MAGFDIKSLSSAITSKEVSPTEASHKTIANQQTSIKTPNDSSTKPQISHGPAVVVDPLYVMTPDGVLHKREGDDYSPDITIQSYNRLKKS